MPMEDDDLLDMASAQKRTRHVDEIERRVRGKPLRSSATSAIDGPLTRQVRNRLYLLGLPVVPSKTSEPAMHLGFRRFFRL
jgi:hypothetical protein